MSDMNRPEDAPEELDSSEDRLAEDVGDVIDDDDSGGGKSVRIPAPPD
jgi:hypothetical protein